MVCISAYQSSCRISDTF